MTVSSLEHAVEAAPRRRLFSWGALVAAACLVVAWIVTTRVARVYPVSSDDATGVLEAAAVLRGNVLLHGWSLSGVAFTTIDLPFYVVALKWWGPEPSLLRDVPVAIYVTALAVAVLLGRGSCQSGRAALGVATVLVLLGLPAGGWAEFVTKGYIRVGTTLGLFAALLALDTPEGRRVSNIRVALFTGLLTITCLSDPYAAYVGAPALLVVCALGAAGIRRYDAVPVGRVLIAVLAAIVTAHGLSRLIEAVGGYSVRSSGIDQALARRGFISGVIQSTVTLGTYLPDLYRCGLPADFTPQTVMLWAGSAIGPALLLFAFVRGCPIRIRREQTPVPADFVADVLWFLAVLAVAAFVANSSTKDRSLLRYMIPFVFSGAVLTARVLADRVPNPRTQIVALIALALAYAFTIKDDMEKPRSPDRAEGLAKWLVARDLNHGYGPFWDASIVTASSRGKVQVRPVWVRGISSQSHAIEPMYWMADQRWFSEGPVTFVVYEPRPGDNYQFGVNEHVCITSFGPPTARYMVGPYNVLVWDHDLRPFLRVESKPAQTDP